MRNMNLRILAPSLLAVVAACSVGCGGRDGGNGNGGATSQEALNSNEETAYQFFIGKGLTDFQSAAIVGNLMQESSVDPTIAQYGGGPGRGIAQWSVGGRWDTSSEDNVAWYAGQQGQSIYSLDLQLEFIWFELTTYGYGFDSLKSSTNLSDAEYAFQAYYEICGQCDQSARLQYAQEVLDANGGGSSGGGARGCSLAGQSFATNTCTETLQCDNGNWVNRTGDPASCNSGVEPNGACITDSGDVVAQNTCTSSQQCDNGVWVDRSSDPSACNGDSGGCSLAGSSYAQDTCTETLQCDNGNWVNRTGDPASCNSGVEPNGACITDSGSVVPENTCTSSQQCDNGVWVDRSSDPSACL